MTIALTRDAHRLHAIMTTHSNTICHNFWIDDVKHCSSMPVVNTTTIQEERSVSSGAESSPEIGMSSIEYQKHRRHSSYWTCNSHDEQFIFALLYSLEGRELNRFDLMVYMKIFLNGLQDKGLSLTATEKEMKRHNFINILGADNDKRTGTKYPSLE